jgi:two-component system, LytTR family, response regulator
MKSFSAFTTGNVSASALSSSNNAIVIQFMGRPVSITPDTITFMEGDGNYTFIHTNNGRRYLVSKTLKTLSEELASNFIRVHKSYVVNAHYVVEQLIHDRVLKMAGGKEVLVSRRKFREITEILDHSYLRFSA